MRKLLTLIITSQGGHILMINTFGPSLPHSSPVQVICVHDVSSIYRVPLLLEDQGVMDYFSTRLNLHVDMRPRRMLTKWKEMSDR